MIAGPLPQPKDEVWTNAGVLTGTGSNITEMHVLGVAGVRLTGSDTNNDKIFGSYGADIFNGGAGDDALSGGPGADVLTGGVGRDALIGGTGGDRFVFNSIYDSRLTLATRDTITDFSHAQGDHVDLTNVYSGTLLFRGTAGYTGSGLGQLWVEDLGSNRTMVHVSTNADTSDEMQIVMLNVNAGTLTGGDFLL